MTTHPEAAPATGPAHPAAAPDPWAPPSARQVGAPWPPSVPPPVVGATGYPITGGYADAPAHADAPGYANAPGYGTAPGFPAPPGSGPFPDPAGVWPGQAAPETDAWAIATFALAFVFWPLAFVTGPLALARTRGRRRGGRGWAVAGLAISTVWAVATVALVALVFSGMRTGWFDDLVPSSEGTAAAVRGVDVGECYRELETKAVAVACTGPHDGEVFFRTPVVGTGTVGYPGEALLREEAEGLCYAAFGAYVGVDYLDSEWVYGTFVPDAESWADGDREAVCAVVPFGPAALTGTAAGSGS